MRSDWYEDMDALAKADADIVPHAREPLQMSADLARHILDYLDEYPNNMNVRQHWAYYWLARKDGCAYCGRWTKDGLVLQCRCEQCRVAKYCDIVCQSRHEDAHATRCGIYVQNRESTEQDLGNDVYKKERELFAQWNAIKDDYFKFEGEKVTVDELWNWMTDSLCEWLAMWTDYFALMTQHLYLGDLVEDDISVAKGYISLYLTPAVDWRNTSLMYAFRVVAMHFTKSEEEPARAVNSGIVEEYKAIPGICGIGRLRVTFLHAAQAYRVTVGQEMATAEMGCYTQVMLIYLKDSLSDPTAHCHWNGPAYQQNLLSLITRGVTFDGLPIADATARLVDLTNIKSLDILHKLHQECLDAYPGLMKDVAEGIITFDSDSNNEDNDADSDVATGVTLATTPSRRKKKKKGGKGKKKKSVALEQQEADIGPPLWSRPRSYSVHLATVRRVGLHKAISSRARTTTFHGHDCRVWYREQYTPGWSPLSASHVRFKSYSSIESNDV